MVVRHYHFHQQIVSGGVFPPNIQGGQDMSVPPPVATLARPVVQSHPGVMPSHPKALTPKTNHTTSNKPGPHQKTVVRVRSDKPILTLWGTSHLAENHLLGPDLKEKLKAQFQRVINPSEGGAKLTNVITEQIEIAMRSHPGPKQVYVIMFGGNNMRRTNKPVLEVAKLVSRFRRIMAEAQKANVRVLLCGDIPDPRPAVDSRLKLLDEALKDLEMGEGNRFIALRSSLLDAQGDVRKDIFKPRGDIHLNAAGTQIVSLRIRKMLEIMLPALVQAPVPVTGSAPAQTPAQVQTPTPAKVQRKRVQAPVQDEVQAPVVVNETSPVVNAPLVADVVNAPVIIQHVAVVDQDQVGSPMEVEDEDSILERLFFKKYGRALPEKEKEKEKDNEVDQIKFVIDLTDDTDEMEVATPVEVVVVKTEPIETSEMAEINSDLNASAAAKVIADRKERRELVRARKALIAFGKTLRKTKVIPEKEVPEVSADTNMSEDTSVNHESVNTIETAEQVIARSDRRAEQILAESEAAIAASKEFTDEFGDTPLDEFDDESEFRLFPDETDVINEDDDEMIDDI